MPDLLASLQLLGWLAFVYVFYRVLRAAPLSEFAQNRFQQHIISASAVCVLLLWLFRTGLEPSMPVHFLWLTTLTLLLGFQWAFLAATFALIATALMGKSSLAMFGIDGLVSVLLPIAITYWIYQFVSQHLKHTVFNYVFICGFFAGALGMSLKMMLMAGVYWSSGGISMSTIVDKYLVLLPTMSLTESTFNGISLVVLITYCPSWILTFHNKFNRP